MDFPPIPAINLHGPTHRVLTDIFQYLVRLYNSLTSLQVTSIQKSVTIASGDQFADLTFPEVDDPARIVGYVLHADPEDSADSYDQVTVTPFTLEDTPRTVFYHISKPITGDDKTYTLTVYFRAR